MCVKLKEIMIDPALAKAHIIFDCDGTLISSYEGIIDCLVIFLESELLRIVTRDEVKAKYYAQLDVMAAQFNITADTPEEQKRLLDKWAKISSSRDHQYALFPEIKELLIACEKQDWALYVWTGRDRTTTLEILKALGIMPYFWDVRTATDGIPKPHPMGMEELVGDQDKQKIVMIGDSGADLNGANNFGCHFIGARWCQQADHSSLVKCENVKAPMDCFALIKNLIKN
jgi:phosphoglycolate phosphatase